MIEGKLTEDEENALTLLRQIIPRVGLVTGLGYYIKDGELYITSGDGFEKIKEIIELLKRMEIISIKGITAKLEIKQK